MSKIFEAVQAMSGQGNCITIPAPYLDYFSGDPQAHLLGAILNQLVFWSGKASTQGGGWFYKTHEEMASEIRGVTGEQVRKAVKKLITAHLSDVIFTAKRKVNGTPTMHYRVDGDALITRIFPDSLETAILPNGNVNIDESKRQYRRMETAKKTNPGNGNIAESYLYTDHYTEDHLQKKNTSGQPPSAADRGGDFSEEIHITDQAILVLKHLNLMTGSKYTTAKTTLENIRARLVDGNTQEELETVVEYMADRWLGTEWAKYLTPATIFHPGKFSANLLGAQAWAKAGRKSHQDNRPDDSTERDAAYRRFIGSAKPLRNPSQLEQTVKAEASKAGVRGMRADFAVSRWNSIWKDCAGRVSGGKAA
ncbi:conserved phage C-terminal domain-containing protein [Erwinia sp. S38]|uniref:conserved phage C-terminal domain-containing protein n=1 Tax=Erwinia sp. S38 TaxID=2769338 RepID=UPI00190C23D6|nr:conserved phage C-terminal domain-containing protein [Erwinia sp. S38]MBK0003148.1 conserved phage C-terminal domain-containing protein [Erwinia sp. S38]